MEKEFRVLSVRQKLHELTREELEDFLVEALETMMKLAHQVEQMHNYINSLEG